MLFTKWNELSLPQRIVVANAFGISKTGFTHVVNNQVAQDGYNFKDVERAITVAKMQEYLGTKENDFDILWENAVLKAEGKDFKITAEVLAEDWKGVVGSKGEAVIEEPKKKRGRPAKKTAGNEKR